MKFKQHSLMQLAEMVCGDFLEPTQFIYRSSSALTEFFRDCDADYVHDGSTRRYWRICVSVLRDSGCRLLFRLGVPLGRTLPKNYTEQLKRSHERARKAPR